ncbi:MAG: hypothetical protein NUV77_04515 [Thermoguttaceae bacterium]|nr:hypothetical protein [Thermoguttaceae bacterium]
MVFDYEVMMFRKMCSLLANGNQEYADLSWYVKNAVTESAILHTRQLADILLSRGSQPDDINLQTLLPGFQPQGLNTLRQHYGDNRTANTPCWTINKRLAHATSQRGDSFDYSSLLNGLVPLLEGILVEVQDQRARVAG